MRLGLPPASFIYASTLRFRLIPVERVVCRTEVPKQGADDCKCLRTSLNDFLGEVKVTIARTNKKRSLGWQENVMSIIQFHLAYLRFVGRSNQTLHLTPPRLQDSPGLQCYLGNSASCLNDNECRLMYQGGQVTRR